MSGDVRNEGIGEPVRLLGDYHSTHSSVKRRKFSCRERNTKVDSEINRSCFKVSPSVVALVSYSGDSALSEGCGTIIEADGDNCYVLTSMNLIRSPTDEEVATNTIADDLKVTVHTADEDSYPGEVHVYDFHYNICLIKFSATSMKAAKLRKLKFEKDICESTSHISSFPLRPHSVIVKPGDRVAVVGRYFRKPYDAMLAPGDISDLRAPDYDCRELFVADCSITRCGDGSPLINLSGEVIGIVFYHIACDCPFLPINIASYWWEHYKEYNERRHPTYGFEAVNLCAADFCILERFMKKFPNISGGVLVNEVLPQSVAAHAGLLQGDVIMRCGGNFVQDFLELWEIMFDKVGDVVELEIARTGTILRFSMRITEATPNELNKWPRFDYG